MTTLAQPLGGVRLVHSWRGHDIAYVRRGSGAPMLLVHSIHACAWSMEWRLVVPELSEHFTTYSIDLLGFGASAHPALAYTADLYVDLLRDFLSEVIGAPAVLVGSSLGGTYVIDIAARHPHLAKAVCAVGPAGISRLLTPGGTAGAMVQKLFHSSFPGASLFSALVSKPSIRFFLKDIYHDRQMLTDEVVELYSSSARQQNARYAPAAFVGMRLNRDIRQALAAMPAPFMLIWGQFAAQTPFREAELVRTLRPEATYVVLPAGDLPHEECPAAFNRALLRFLGVTS